MLIFFESILNFVFVCLSVKSVIELYEGDEMSSFNQVLNIISLFIVPYMMMGILSINLTLLLFSLYCVSIFNADMFNNKTERTLKTLIHNTLLNISYVLLFLGIMTNSTILQIVVYIVITSSQVIYPFFAIVDEKINMDGFYDAYQSLSRNLGISYLLDCFRIFLPHGLMFFVIYFLFQNIIPLGLVPTVIFSLIVSSGILFTIPSMTSSQFNLLYLNFLNQGALLFLVVMPMPVILKALNVFSSLISTLGTDAKNQTLKVVRYIYDHVKMTYYLSKNEKMNDRDALRYSTVIDLKTNNNLTDALIDEFEIGSHREYFNKMEFNIENLRTLKQKNENYQTRLERLTNREYLLEDLKNRLQNPENSQLIRDLVSETNHQEETIRLFEQNLNEIESFTFVDDLLPHLSSALIDYDAIDDHTNESKQQALMKLIEIARSIFACHQASGQLSKSLVRPRDPYTQYIEENQNKCRADLNKESVWALQWKQISTYLTEPNSYHSNLQKEIFINPDSDLGDHSALNRDGFTMMVLFHSMVLYPIHSRLLDGYFTKEEYHMLVDQLFKLDESVRNELLRTYLYPGLKESDADGIAIGEYVQESPNAQILNQFFDNVPYYFNDSQAFKGFYKQLMYSTGRIVDLNQELENLSIAFKVIFGYLLFPIFYDLCYFYHGEFILPRIDFVIKELLWYEFYGSVIVNTFYLVMSILTLVVQFIYEILKQLITLILSMLYQPFFAINQCAKHTYHFFTREEQQLIDSSHNSTQVPLSI
ncbi:MAG: hypothetical protein CBD38_02500 [bacterium TMED178]|nr:MAG: hypothetical protein CBD38_02500 [bacterium TMED178]